MNEDKNNGKILYTPLEQTYNSMLTLFEDDRTFDAKKVLPIIPSEVANEIIGSIDIPRRDFWERAKEFLD